MWQSERSEKLSLHHRRGVTAEGSRDPPQKLVSLNLHELKFHQLSF